MNLTKTIISRQGMELSQEEIRSLSQRLTNPLIVFDLETTGVDKVKDEIVQFYGIRIEPNGSSKSLEFLCKPSIPIPIEASNIHGITNGLVANEKPFGSYVSELISLFDGCMIGGYNVFRFDLPIINRQFTEQGVKGVFKNSTVIDSFKLALLQHPKDLSSMLKVYTGEDMQNTLSASADVIATVKILAKQLEREKDSIDAIAPRTAPPPNKLVGLNDQIVFVDDNPVFNFGKHKGKKLTYEKDYCKWILSADFDEEIKEFIRSVI